MRPVDQKLAHNDTDSGELELSVEAIALALEKVGLHVDPATEEGRLRAAELINEALSDAARTDKIIAALEADAPLASDGAGGKVTGIPAKRFIPKTRLGERTPADYFLMDDELSQGRLLTAPDAITRLKGKAK